MQDLDYLMRSKFKPLRLRIMHTQQAYNMLPYFATIYYATGPGQKKFYCIGPKFSASSSFFVCSTISSTASMEQPRISTSSSDPFFKRPPFTFSIR